MTAIAPDLAIEHLGDLVAAVVDVANLGIDKLDTVAAVGERVVVPAAGQTRVEVLQDGDAELGRSRIAGA